MKRLYIVIICLCSVHIVFGQNDTVGSLTISNYELKGPCYDNNGKPLNPGELMSLVYSVKEYPSKTPIELNITRVTIGSQSISINFY